MTLSNLWIYLVDNFEQKKVMIDAKELVVHVYQNGIERKIVMKKIWMPKKVTMKMKKFP